VRATKRRYRAVGCWLVEKGREKLRVEGFKLPRRQKVVPKRVDVQVVLRVGQRVERESAESREVQGRSRSREWKTDRWKVSSEISESEVRKECRVRREEKKGKKAEGQFYMQ
jgi:hypothetical protein